MVIVLAAALFTAASHAAEPRITHGPMLGRLSAHSIGVWARTSQPATFRVRYGRERGSLDQVSPPVTTRLKADNTGWVQIENLQPDTRFYYDVALDGATELAPGGSFHTLPDADKHIDAERNPRGLFNFTFEVGCCNFQARGTRNKVDVPVFETMLRTHGDELHFAIQNGDWSYEDFREYTPDEWRAQVGIAEPQTPSIVRAAPPIVGAWENYKVYLDRSDELARWHRHVPVLFTFDDHEIVDDAAGAGSVGERPRRALFRDIGAQAWYDYLGWANPVHTTQSIILGTAELAAGGNVLTDEAADFARLNLDETINLHVHWGGSTSGEIDKRLDTIGGDPNAGVYEIVRVIDPHRMEIRPAAKQAGQASYSIGRPSYFRQRVANCEFLFLDTRSHRELPDNSNPKKPGVSLLGRQQKQWLKESMSASNADCFFVVSTVNFMVPHYVDVNEAGYVGYIDSWPAFWHEREELIGFFAGLGKKVFILTGDLHNSFVAQITDNVWEFASAPHNSGNAAMESEGRRPPNGPFDSFGRECFLRWSTWFDNRFTRRAHAKKVYCIVQVNNAFFNPTEEGRDRWQAYPHPQIVIQYYDGLTGKLLYAESVVL